jgi:hypothetical protein
MPEKIFSFKIGTASNGGARFVAVKVLKLEFHSVPLAVTATVPNGSLDEF